jgi:hypothetical protein
MLLGRRAWQSNLRRAPIGSYQIGVMESKADPMQEGIS